MTGRQFLITKSPLTSLNQLVRAEFGDIAPEITIDPLLDFTVRYSTLGKTLELLA